MAEDHRYSWLDDAAVERLLRGEPVEGQPGAPDGRGDESYAEAERLAAVLDAVRRSGPPARPLRRKSALPGEEAAMAAFRAARVAVEAEAEAVAEPGMARRSQRIRKFGETAAAAPPPAGEHDRDGGRLCAERFRGRGRGGRAAHPVRARATTLRAPR
ncbi:hypothetical protein SANTM175S_07200 [Streptomyces antimycoticus]